MSNSIPAAELAVRHERWYRAVWRWHFYAGLFCVPFVVWLSVTGGIYLFKPQIEAALYAPYRDVAVAGRPLLLPTRIATAATAAAPGSILHKYVLPDAPGDAVQVLVGVGGVQTRAWVHPQSGAVLYAVPEEDRLMRVVFRLHGELLAGGWGSALVEIAACWTIVMIVTGLFLWWPRGGAKLAGTVWPRLRGGKRVFWRDLHAVTGLWVSLAAAFLIVSGLPWANAWGDYLRQVRGLTGTAAVKQDWSAGSAADARATAALDRGLRAAPDDHAGHEGHDMVVPAPRAAGPALDTVVREAAALGLRRPAEITPPSDARGRWLIQAATLGSGRLAIEMAADGRVIGALGPADRHWIDRAVTLGIAVHEGTWLGLANQLANLAVLIGLVTLSVSSVVLWWRRRPVGRLGAPVAFAPLRHSRLLVGGVVALGVLMPLFGVTLALVVLAERMMPRAAGGWLGLRA